MVGVSFDQAVSVLLKPIADIDDLNTMVEDPLNDLWTSGTIADNLRNKLEMAYDPLVDTIGEIAEILGSIATPLHIQGSQKV